MMSTSCYLGPGFSYLRNSEILIRHTIRPVSAGTVPVLRALSRRPGQSTKMSRLGIQSARIVPHSGVARLSAAISTPQICLQ